MNLLPCPFCGNDEPLWWDDTTVMCGGIDCPLLETHFGWKDWNTRADALNASRRQDETEKTGKALLYNEIAAFYDKKPIGIDGLWQLHFFVQAWLNQRHDELCQQDTCGHLETSVTNISELEQIAKLEQENSSLRERLESAEKEKAALKKLLKKSLDLFPLALGSQADVGWKENQDRCMREAKELYRKIRQALQGDEESK